MEHAVHLNAVFLNAVRLY